MVACAQLICLKPLVLRDRVLVKTDQHRPRLVTCLRETVSQQPHLLRRFWRSASGFWSGPRKWRAWLLTLSLFAIAGMQLVTQYWLNFWNRDFFDALEQKNEAALATNVALFFPLAAITVLLAVASVWGRMTTQRLWRRHLTTHLIREWLADGRFRLLGHLNGSAHPLNSEYRIAEDSRIATDAPIDLMLALFSSILTAVVFLRILAEVGGPLTIELAGRRLTIPAYLAVAVAMYSGVVTAAILLFGRRYTDVVQDQVQAEAAFRAAANIIRERGEGIIVDEDEAGEVSELWRRLAEVIEQWRRVCWQHMRVALIGNANGLFVPVVGLILCVPKYLDGIMSLGEVTQAAAAFVSVQGAFNWLVDNFQRMADWRAAANRIAVLLLALDDLKQQASSRAATRLPES
jgi:putative ATP-binding cassette transporter